MKNLYFLLYLLIISPWSDMFGQGCKFAKDELDNQFFLHVDNFESGWTRWGYLQLHDKLAVKFKEISNDNVVVC